MLPLSSTERAKEFLWKKGRWLFQKLSCEWCLLGLGRNGGGVISVRATAMAAFAIAMAHMLLGSNISRKELLIWFVTAWGAVYLALYARFASQWQYLASVYNQIKQAEVSMDRNSPLGVQALVEWKAAFIEDCKALHLAGKPAFASVIRRWAADNDVRRVIVAEVGESRFNEILQCADRAERF